MMKYSLLFFLMFAGGMQATAQYDAALPAVVTAASMGLRGPVAEVVETYTDMQGDEGIGMVEEKLLFVFDTKGRLSSKTITSYDDKKQKNNHSHKTNYRYTAGGDVASVAVYEDGKMQDSAAMHYDRRGRLMRTSGYNEKQEAYKRVQYTWNKGGRLMTVRHRGEGNVIEQMIKISYSDDGSTVEETHLDAQLKFLYRIATVTNSDSGGGQRVMRFEYYKPDTCTGMVSYLTDAGGHKVEQTIMNEAKQVTEYRTTEYDTLGNPSSATVFTTEKQLESTLYTYDGHGNWIVKAVYYNNMPHHTIGRNVLYRADDSKKSRVRVTEGDKAR